MNTARCKFLIVGVQRTGSSALAEMIDTHSDIAVGWEWTEHAPFLRKIRQMEANLDEDFGALRPAAREQINSSLTPTTQALGFRRLFGASHLWLLHPQYSAKLMYDRFAAHLAWLRAHPEVRLVHIVRSNHLSWVKSKFVTRAAGNFVGQAHPEDMRVTIPVREAVARVKSKLWIDAKLAELKTSNDYLAISYEDFSGSLPCLADNAARFLGGEPGKIQPATTSIRKQSTRPDSEYIQNYDQLERAINRIARQ